MVHHRAAWLVLRGRQKMNDDDNIYEKIGEAVVCFAAIFLMSGLIVLLTGV